MIQIKPLERPPTSPADSMFIKMGERRDTKARIFLPGDFLSRTRYTFKRTYASCFLLYIYKGNKFSTFIHSAVITLLVEFNVT